MTFRMRKTDYELLKTIAEFRFLTVKQISILLKKNRQAVSRRLAEIRDEGLLEYLPQQLGHNRGRPEILYELSVGGARRLIDSGCIPGELPIESLISGSYSFYDHQLLLNWFRIYLGSIGHLLHQIEVRFISHNSPFDNKLTKLPLNQGVEKQFVPDGIFTIIDTERDKALLFFLEVDMGTETRVSLKRKPTDVRQKLVNYGNYFDTQGYKQFEPIWKQPYHGFRLLFLTNNSRRLKDLCVLVQSMPPSDYVWLTDQSRLFQEGIGGRIWHCGGRLQESPLSILGNLAYTAPLEISQ